jgi:hypothetical protein
VGGALSRGWWCIILLGLVRHLSVIRCVIFCFCWVSFFETSCFVWFFGELVFCCCFVCFYMNCSYFWLLNLYRKRFIFAFLNSYFSSAFFLVPLYSSKFVFCVGSRM